jgi:hypothetical protein
VGNDHELYVGGLKTNSLLNFLKKKVFFSLKNINNLEELKTSMKKGKSSKAIVYAFNSNNNFTINHYILGEASKMAGIKNTYITDTSEFLETHNIKDFDLMIFTQVREQNYFGGERFNCEEIDNFHDISKNKSELFNLIKLYSRKMFEKLNQDDIENAIDDGIPTLYLIYKYKNQEIHDAMLNLAKKYKKEFWFIKSPLVKDSKLITSYFNITKNTIKNDSILILTVKNQRANDDVEKYVFNRTSILNFENVEQFLFDFKSGKLRFSSSRLIYNHPRNNTNNSPFQILIGSNFVNEINSSVGNNKYAIILLCPVMMKKYNRIHTRLERVYNKLKSNENLAFYQFDPLLNEIEYIDYKKYPSIVIVKNLNWEYEILDDDFTTSNIVNFIKSKIKIEKV